MLATIPSCCKTVNTQSNFQPKTISIDCAYVSNDLHVPTDDAIDNPSQREFLEPGYTEENIFQHMKSQLNRLYSFQNKWPLNDISPESLAEAGLFYLQHEDKVQCPFCYIIIFNWTQGDKPLREHMRKSPKCPFLTGCKVGNIPLLPEKPLNTSLEKYASSSVNVSYKPKNPSMADTRRRLLTFCQWPLKEPSPQQLAECGLYYTGPGDIVTCFFCAGSLGNWEPDDDPWKEHHKFFPDCSFLSLAKNKKSHLSRKKQSHLNEVNKQRQLDNKPILADVTSEIVQQAFDIFPEDLVLKAVKNKAGSPFTLQDICDDILELKQKPDNSTPAVPQQQNNDIKTMNISPSASTSELLLCKVCMDRERSVVFQPCGHFVSCWRCADLIADCPVCRRRITQKIRTYIS